MSELDRQAAKPRSDSCLQGVQIQLSREDGVLLVTLHGLLKYDTIGPIKEQIERALARQPSMRLVLDCACVEFVDSHALTLLLGLARIGGDGGRRKTVLRHPRPMVRQLLRMSRLEGFFTLEGDAADVSESTAPPAPRVPLRPQRQNHR